ncbi:MAG: methyl-accepting chemotaxis protein [Roseburia sp.]|nr:methyl-accepting chemotaxis protein [Roseburia sp.]MCM1431784.1 methyl-accepting chemotaxis protein [Muribaculaceae bacterium]
MQTRKAGNEEQLINTILFIYILGVGLAGFGFVMIFLHGGIRECIFLFSCVAAVITRLLEKRLGGYAKYVYACIPPVMGAITTAVCSTPTSDSYVCLTHYYFVTTLLLVPYYSHRLLRTSTVLTIVVNAVLMILFPAGFLKLHSLIGWIFVAIVYVILFAACTFIVYRTTALFQIVEGQGKESENVLQSVQTAFDSLEESSENIFNSLREFESNTEDIADSSRQINGSADTQINEVESSLIIFNQLNDKIAMSEDRVSQTVETMKELKAKNDEGMQAIRALSEKFEENIKTTQVAASGVEELSRKSSSIGGIIESIREIAHQTNLLALNAAIEAARAGEAGKGFAVVADEINSLSAESSDATKKIDAILKDIIETVEETHQAIDQNGAVVNISSEQLKDTVKIFRVMLEFSEDVIGTTNLLKEELGDIVTIKEQLLGAMKRVEDISRSSVATTEGISAATEEQVSGLESIVKSMKNMQSGMEELSGVLHSNS